MNPLPTHRATSPAYRHLSGRVRVRNSSAERGVFRRRRKTRPSEWAEIHRVVTLSSLPGPWRNSTTPYLAGIMDASFHPAVQEIALCKVPQTGGSEAVNNCIAYAMHLAPGPAMYVYPDELTARENCQDRIGPMFTASPSLRSLMTGRDDDAAALKIKLLRAPIYMAWSRSVSRLANKPIRYLVFDETDKYQTSNAAETDPIRLGEKRTTTFRWNRKIWKISSPTVEAGYIWQAMLAAQVVFVFAAVCPLCGSKQVMHFGEAGKPGGIKWPAEERDPDTIETHELATYQCADCQGHWSDYQRDQAVRLGSWQAKHDGRGLSAYLDAFRPRRIAFHLPAWLSPFISLSKIAAAWLRCKKQDGSINLDAYKDFQNGYAAEPWFNLHQDRHEDDILKLRDDRPSGIVPGDGKTCFLLATVDTQDNGFWYEIRAAGYGKSGESWGVRAGFVDSSAALIETLFESDYQDAAGNRYHLRAAFIDAMGHRTAEVYDLCREYRGRLFPLKGVRDMGPGFTWSDLEFYPGSKKRIPGGLKLVNVNTKRYKDLLHSKLKTSSADPGAWHLAADYNELWAKMLCAEYLDDNGVWVCPSGRDNHAFDLGCYYLALVEFLEIRYRQQPGQQPETKKPAEQPKKTSSRW